MNRFYFLRLLLTRLKWQGLINNVSNAETVSDYF